VRQDTGLRFRTCPGKSGTSVSALPPAKKELRLPICRAGPGFGPGAAKRREPRASAHGPARRNHGFGQGSCRTRFCGFRPVETPGQGRGTSVPKPPNGEPPGLRPRRGARGGTGLSCGSFRTPEEAKPGLALASPLETARREGPGLPGWIRREGTVGAGGDVSPHYRFKGALQARESGIKAAGHSSCPGPGSRQRA